jgi:hypothetical protein
MMDYETLTGQSRLAAAIEAEEYNLFSILKPKLYKDGNMWCVLYGENVQEGIAGFGFTPVQAIYAWNRTWREGIKPSNEPVQHRAK